MEELVKLLDELDIKKIEELETILSIFLTLKD
jgi:hypothetical protein